MKKSKPKVVMEPYADPNDKGNQPKYHTGRECVEPDCTEPAGTFWSPWWCFKCNRVRMDRISNSLEDIKSSFGVGGAASTIKSIRRTGGYTGQ